VGVAPSDAEYVISYLYSIHYLDVSPLKNDLIQKMSSSDFLLVGIAILLRSFKCKKKVFLD